MKNVGLALCVILATGTLVAPTAFADSCTSKATAQQDAFVSQLTCQPAQQSHHSQATDISFPSTPSLVPVFSPRANIGACTAAATVDPAACAPPPPPAPAAPPAAPALTAGRVLQAFQRIPLPHLRSVTQPDEKTLVNFDTIFYVDADQFQRTLTLLGRHVTLAITPSTFTWHHGDGTTAVTSAPGAPYPSKDVVHRYQKAHRTVAHSVTIVWTARYRVGNGPWRDVPGSVSTTGPATDLRIAEAAPVLTGQR